MENTEITTSPTESPLVEESKKLKYEKAPFWVGCGLVITLACSTVAYNFGYKEGENKYKNNDPKLHIFLTPSNGPTTVIPVTLTKNGIGIKFQNSITNIIAIGIEEVNKRD